MLYFENTKEEKIGLTTRNYRAIKVDYDGEPNFIMEIDGNYQLFLTIDEEGFTHVYDLSDTVISDYWEDIIDNIYTKEIDDYKIVEYYKDFDITIAKRV